MAIWRGHRLGRYDPERISGMSVNDYFQQHIFQPLGITNISMFPSQSMKDNLAYMHQKTPDGRIHQRNHLYRRPLMINGEEISKTYNSAGAGCFAKPTECSREPFPPSSNRDCLYELCQLTCPQEFSPHSSAAAPPPQPPISSSNPTPSTRCSPTKSRNFRTMDGKVFQPQNQI